MMDDNTTDNTVIPEEGKKCEGKKDDKCTNCSTDACTCKKDGEEGKKCEGEKCKGEAE